MKVIIVSTPEIGAKIVADRIQGLIRLKPETVLGLATGSSPIPLYDDLVRRETLINWSGVITFNLDEYVGLPPDHEQSYRYFMNQHLFDRIKIKKVQQTFVPNGMAKTGIETMCQDYEREIVRHGGIDMQILGIGNNAHVAFNEPGSAFDSRTRRVELDEATRQANKWFFGGDITKVPTHAISMGMATIMEAGEIFLLGWGYGKAKALARAIEGPVSPEVPASVLQLHSNATFVVDTMAAQKLQFRDRYVTVSDY